MLHDEPFGPFFILEEIVEPTVPIFNLQSAYLRSFEVDVKYLIEFYGLHNFLIRILKTGLRIAGVRPRRTYEETTGIIAVVICCLRISSSLLRRQLSSART